MTPLPPSTKPTCPVETTLRVIAGRWKVLILRELFSGPKRFSTLRAQLQGISQKILTQQLRALETDGLIAREEKPEFKTDLPLKVVYSLTPLGQSLCPVLEAMHHWGARYLRSGGNLKGRGTDLL